MNSETTTIRALVDRFYESYFDPKEKGYKDSDYRLMETHYKSYETFLTELREIFEDEDKVYYRYAAPGVTITGKIIISDLRMEEQKTHDNISIQPRRARLSGNTLACDVYAHIKQVLILEKEETKELDSDMDTTTAKTTRTEYVIGEDKDTKLISVPLLVLEGGRTSLNKNDFNNYSPSELGGYFIIRGNEKVAINSTSTIPNRPRISIVDGVIKLYIKSFRESKQVQHISIRINNRNNNIVTFSSQLLTDMNIFVLMRYFQLSDETIFGLITNGNHNLMGKVEKWINDSHFSHEKNETVLISDEFKYIEQKIKGRDEKSKNLSTKSIRDYFEQEFLPHINTNSLLEKGVYLCYLVKKLLLCSVSGSSPRYYDKDSFLGKQFYTIGYYMTDIVRSSLNKILDKNIEIFKQAEKNASGNIYSLLTNNKMFEIRNILSSFSTSEITNDICVLVSIGTYTYFTVILNTERQSSFTIPYTARRINKSLRQPKQAITKMLDARDFHVSSAGFMDSETPEHGHTVGLTSSLSLVSSISCITRKSEEMVQQAIINYYNTKRDALRVSSSHPNKFIFILESRIIDFIRADKAYEFYNMLRYEKRSGTFIEDDIGIVYDYYEKEIRINTFNGRLTKPVLLFDDEGIELAVSKLNKSELEEFNNIKSFTEMYEKFKHIYEIVDIEQFIYSMVCRDAYMLLENRKKYERARSNRDRTKVGMYVQYELMEAPGDLLNGFNVSAMMFPNMIRGNRVIFGASQIKQTATFSTPDFNNYISNSLFLLGPERPIIISKALKYTRLANIGFGQNAMIALMPYFGMEKDDAVIVKASSVHRGFLTTITSKKYIKQLDKANEANDESNCVRITSNYSKLNKYGYLDMNTVVTKNDVIVKNIVPITKKESTGELITIDNSEVYTNLYPGRLVTHAINVLTNKKEHRMQINSFRPLVQGDKLGTRSAQKGTVSGLIEDRYMPYDENGMRPDIICNPLAIGNRMTSSFWMEAILNACIVKTKGECIDFNLFDGSYHDLLEYAKEILGADLGERILYDPSTNRKQKVPCLFAPLYYSSSRHKVQDKVYGRAKGAINQITRQANGGKGKGGGLKFGEMERDCIIAHGVSYTLLDILSDPYDSRIFLYFCNRCGMLARHFKDMFGYEREICSYCKDSAIIKFQLPYVFLTLIIENMARGHLILPKNLPIKY